jgi:polyhydroxyalkanoate synthesis regulator phasin
MAMIDLIRKTVLAGVGAAVLTKEKVEESLSDLVEKGRISADEAKATAEKIAEDGKREFESVSKDVQKSVSDLLEQVGVGAKDRVDALEKRLLALEIEVQNLAHKKTTES